MRRHRVLVPMAGGFEEIEGITVVDVLRRAGMEVVTAALDEGPVEASRNTRHLSDTTLEKVCSETFDAVILPGGMAGANRLKSDPRIRDCLLRHMRAEKWI